MPIYKGVWVFRQKHEISYFHFVFDAELWGIYWKFMSASIIITAIKGFEFQQLKGLHETSIGRIDILTLKQ